MKKMIFIGLILFITQCHDKKDHATEEKKDIQLVINDKANWYFIIFDPSIAKGKQVTKLGKSDNYVVLDSMSYYSRVKIKNGNGTDISDSMKMIRYSEQAGLKVLEFYYPSDEEKNKFNFKDAGGELFPLEYKGQMQLDSIIHQLNPASLKK